MIDFEGCKLDYHVLIDKEMSDAMIFVGTKRGLCMCILVMPVVFLCLCVCVRVRACVHCVHGAFLTQIANHT